MMKCNQFDVGALWIVKTPEVEVVVGCAVEDVLELVLEDVLATVFDCMLTGIFKSAGTINPKVFWLVEL